MNSCTRQACGKRFVIPGATLFSLILKKKKKNYANTVDCEGRNIKKY